MLWGSYFIPIKLSAASMWVAAFPLALGIFAGSALPGGAHPPAAALERRAITCAPA